MRTDQLCGECRDSAALTQPIGKLDIAIIRPSIYSEVGKQKVDEKMEGKARVELNCFRERVEALGY